MKVLVTGANGYIGSHVVALLLDQGIKVIACDVVSDNIDKRAEIINYSIFDGKEGDDMFTLLGKPDICLHLAWRDGFVHNSQRQMQDLSSHYMFLTNLINHGLKHLAVMGTMHEIGYWNGKIDENTPCRPLSLYGIAKNTLRESMMLYAASNNCLIQWIRGYYIYGDDLKNHSIFTKLIQAAERGDQVFPFTTGKNKYDFMSVHELVKQIVAVIMQDEVTGIINCCTGNPVSLATKVEQFIQEHHLNIALNYGAFPDRPYDSPCVYGDASKIQQIMAKTNLK